MSAIRNVMMASVAVFALATPALAQDAIRIGLLGGENEADRLADNQCLIDKLPAALGVKEVQLFPAADYDGVIQGLLGGTLDVASLGASGFAKAYLANPDAVEPFLTTVQTDGSMGYHSVMGEFSEGYTSGNIRSMVDKGMLDMEDVVEIWQSPLIPNGPTVMRKDLPQDLKDKIVKFFTELPAADYDCFRAIENGDFKGYAPVSAEFYQPIIDARKATIGG